MSYLYVTEQNTHIGIRSNYVTVSNEKGEEIEIIPIELLESVNVFGTCQITTQCLQICMGKNIPVLYYSKSGNYFGRTQPMGHINVERQRKQAAFAGTDTALEMARKLITAKIHNQMVVMKRYAKSRFVDIEMQCRQMRILMSKVAFANQIDMIMGYEGLAARIYFSVLSTLVEEDFAFHGRNRRPALDPFNVMANLGYTMLMNEVYGKIDAKGLNPYFGFIHQDRENHPTLASDLMEEWRPVIVDSVIMSLINGHEISREHFQTGIDDEGIYFTKEGLGIFLSKMETKLRQENKYLPDVDKAIPFRRAIDMQINAFAHVIEENDVSMYSPLWIR